MGIMSEYYGAGSPRFEADVLRFHVTAVTIAAHSEDRLIFMADAAGKPRFHLGHGVATAVDSAYKGATVATAALQQSGMDSVAEKGIAFFERHILDGRVATAAVTLDREGRTAVVTATARLLCLHLPHCVASAIGAGHKELVVAVSTNMTESQVGIMAEGGVGREGNIPDRVALGAVSLYGKCSVAVMAGTTGDSLLHLFHGDMGIIGTGAEDGIMTVGAAIRTKPQMKFVAENDRPEVGNIHRDFLRHVAPGALGESKRSLCVVTCTAGLAGLHFLHGYRSSCGPDFENCIVAKGTIAAQGLQVDRVIEIYRAGGFGLEGHHLIILGKKEERQAEEEQ